MSLSPNKASEPAQNAQGSALEEDPRRALCTLMGSPASVSPESTVCLGCGKDPYLSSTGCLCPLGEGKWVPGKGSYGEGFGGPARGTVKCPCGVQRRTAAKDPRRALPCGSCGAPAADVDELGRACPGASKEGL